MKHTWKPNLPPREVIRKAMNKLSQANERTDQEPKVCKRGKCAECECKKETKKDEQ
jgi:hypothetical protein